MLSGVSGLERKNMLVFNMVCSSSAKKHVVATNFVLQQEQRCNVNVQACKVHSFLAYKLLYDGSYL